MTNAFATIAPSTSAANTTAFVNAVIDAMITEAERSQREISRFCISALFAYVAIWAMFGNFALNCGRSARHYYNYQMIRDIDNLTVLRSLLCSLRSD